MLFSLVGFMPAMLIAENPFGEEETVLVAVATNFAEVARQLQTDFQRQGHYTMTIATGSTGQLYAQIIHGAPYDIFLAADQERPRRLEVEGLAVPSSRITYAIGQLTLWSPDPDLLGPGGLVGLHTGEIRRLAMANPDLAPYGAAAREVLTSLGLYGPSPDGLRDRIIMGENIGQTWAMVLSGNADLGFVALSYVLSPNNPSHDKEGSRWDIPANLYTPIRQDAVILMHGMDNPAVWAFFEFLGGDEAKATITSFGYGTP
ncbi:molybdate ABC transporter substrate-binding protein [Candidatus Neomarinimicrobiota bacterium]